jgi:hypothetical protein
MKAKTKPASIGEPTPEEHLRIAAQRVLDAFELKMPMGGELLRLAVWLGEEKAVALLQLAAALHYPALDFDLERDLGDKCVPPDAPGSA